MGPPADANETASPITPFEHSPTSSATATAPNPEACAADADRPRRKKARRACAACQRAHLTCGDERPCVRCTKRGIAHNCQDGARKKAKYLFDAPDESLGMKHDADSADVSSALPPATGQPIVPRSQPMYAADGTINGAAPLVPLIPHQYRSFGPTSLAQLQEASYNGVQRPESASMHSTGHLAPLDMNLFNMDVSDMNFDNYFGALEFGILGHLSSGAVASSEDGIPLSPSDTSLNGLPTPTGMDQSYQTNTYSSAVSQPAWHFHSQAVPSLAPHAETSTTIASRPPQNHEGPTPSLTMSRHNATDTSTSDFPSGQRPPHVHSVRPAEEILSGRMTMDTQATPRQSTSSLPIKRDASLIYSSVTTPYSYTAGFHALTALLQRRFTPQKTLRIAKALASIRPSFIASTKDLKPDDLTFMEKCLQRTLLQYDDFINAYGCPTIICRRTGEVAAASKEFTQLTGWQGDVLLGTAQNQNSNLGISTLPDAGPNPETKQKPDTKSQDHSDPTRHVQPVFLAELLDEDSVVQFYEDFAELAFGDPRGHVVRPCKLLRYLPAGQLDTGGPAAKSSKSVDCMYCWSVKRDVFDIPMLIVINVSHDPGAVEQRARSSGGS